MTRATWPRWRRWGGRGLALGLGGLAFWWLGCLGPAVVAPAAELCLLRDRGELLPLLATAAGSTALVQLGDAAAAADYAAALRPLAQAPLATAATVLLLLHGSPAATAAPAELAAALAALREPQRLVAVVLGPPQWLPLLAPAATCLWAADSSPALAPTLALALQGRGRITGRLPQLLPQHAFLGHGLSYYGELAAAAALPPGAAALADELRELLQQAVAARVFPGAVCGVLWRGQPVLRLAVGRLDYRPTAAAVQWQTPYDLASLTKVVATTALLLRLAAAGSLSLDDPVQRWLPGFVGSGKAAVTLRQLLLHQGGLPAYVDFHRRLRGSAAILAAAEATPLAYAPGTGPRYSDVGFLLLGAVAAAAGGRPLAELVASEVLQPLGMQTAQFVPLDGPPLAAAAPTEEVPERGGVVRGYVHDENAAAMGGIAGHAGLFATADDLLAFAAVLLQGGRGWLPAELVAAAVQPAAAAADRSRGLGFALLGEDSFAGSGTGPQAFGHTGFTGTSLYVEPALDLAVVLLTNRVHPSRADTRIQGLRRRLHQLVRTGLRPPG